MSETKAEKEDTNVLIFVIGMGSGIGLSISYKIGTRYESYFGIYSSIKEHKERVEGQWKDRLLLDTTQVFEGLSRREERRGRSRFLRFRTWVDARCEAYERGVDVDPILSEIVGRDVRNIPLEGSGIKEIAELGHWALQKDEEIMTNVFEEVERVDEKEIMYKRWYGNQYVFIEASV